MTTTDLDRLIWCDIETTGLSPGDDVILEIGFVITDIELNEIDTFSRLVWDDTLYQKKVDNMPLLVKEMHQKSNLILQAQAEGFYGGEAAMDCVDWLKGHGVGREGSSEPLCGSSVQFDRSFFDADMPSISNLFSYRNIDISTLKELCKRYNPDIYERLDDITEPVKAHRVLSDLMDTINEFKFYKQEFLLI